MSISGPNNVERALQTDPTMLRYASAITEQNKCCGLLANVASVYKALEGVLPGKIFTSKIEISFSILQ